MILEGTFLAGLVAGVALSLVVLLPQRRRAWGRAELGSDDVATAFRRSTRTRTR